MGKELQNGNGRRKTIRKREKSKNRKTRRKGIYKMKEGKMIKRRNNKIGFKINTLQWKHNAPKEYVETFSKLYFRKPDIVNEQNRGICIWYPKKNERFYLYDNKYPNIFSEHWCRDELIHHTCPSEHTDFFYSFIDIELNKKRWSDVLSISGSVGYDALKKKLYARCASVEANIASLYTCLLINNGKKTIEEVQQGKLYAKNIQSTRNESDVIRMYKYLLKHTKKQVPKTGYWEIAFPNYQKNKEC